MIKRLQPNWYSVPVSGAQIDPNDLVDVDFSRDLGPMMRLQDSKFEKMKKGYLLEMTDVCSPEEIFLLILSGIVPMDKLNQYNKMLPTQENEKIPPFNKTSTMQSAPVLEIIRSNTTIINKVLDALQQEDDEEKEFLPLSIPVPLPI